MEYEGDNKDNGESDTIARNTRERLKRKTKRSQYMRKEQRKR
jgi:hypothetical protein